jgi:hypothetical protein
VERYISYEFSGGKNQEIERSCGTLEEREKENAPNRTQGSITKIG